MITKLLIDADILIYRVGYKTNDETLRHACSTMDEAIGNILLAYPETPYCLYLTGPGQANYRHKYAVTAPYKGNRKDVEKPTHYHELRSYLMESHHDCVMTVDNEADDAIAIDFTALMQSATEDDYPVLVSVDKDFDQLEGCRYDFTKGVEVWNDKQDAMNNLWMQCLTGDRVDNIKGIFRVGPKKAHAILEDCHVHRAYYNKCIAAFIEKEEISDAEAKARVVENMRLLYLQREPNDLWSPETHLD